MSIFAPFGPITVFLDGSSKPRPTRTIRSLTCAQEVSGPNPDALSAAIF